MKDSNIKIDFLLKQISTDFNGSFKERESTWFNGKTYMPLYSREIKFEYKGWIFLMNYEFRYSNFSKPNGFSGFLEDIHIVNIKIEKLNQKFIGFEVSSRSFIQKIFNSGIKFNVESSNMSFRQKLMNSTELNSSQKSQAKISCPKLIKIQFSESKKSIFY
jgi:hypothetical protein